MIDWLTLILTGLFLGVGVAITNALLFGFGLIFLKLIADIEWKIKMGKDKLNKLKIKMQNIKDKIYGKDNISDPTA